MREKYESLSLATLKELAKARGLKGISTLRKPALIERMLQEDEKEQKDTGAVSETVQKEEIREEKKDRQEEHQTPVRQYRQNGHVQESRAFYDNRRKITGRRAEREPITAPVKAADTATVRASFQKITAVRMKAADTEILRERISERTEAKMKAADTEILRMKIPEFIIVRTKTEEADTARRRIREHIIIRTKPEEYSQEENPSLQQSEGKQRKLYSRTMPGRDSSAGQRQKANGILEVLQDGYGFIRCENFLPGRE